MRFLVINSQLKWSIRFIQIFLPLSGLESLVLFTFSCFIEKRNGKHLRIFALVEIAFYMLNKFRGFGGS